MKTLSTLVVVALLAFGGYWYFNHQAEVKTFINNMETAKNNAVATTTTDADNFIKRFRLLNVIFLLLASR